MESVAHPGKCIDTLGHFYKEAGLYSCSHNLASPHGSQFFFLGHNRDIEYYTDSAYCLENYGSKLEVHACHHQQGKQYFRYNLDTQQMFAGVKETKCLEADDGNAKVAIKICDSNEIKQKWKWGKVYEENLRNWANVGAKIIQ
jgi:Ricin-type beta-trefoil lectin domain